MMLFCSFKPHHWSIFNAYCGITDIGLTHVAVITTLLLSENGKITRAGLQHLRRLPLKALYLRELPIGDEGMKLLADFALEELSIPQCHVSDAGLRWLKEKPLRALDLGSNPITIDCFLSLPRTIQE